MNLLPVTTYLDGKSENLNELLELMSETEELDIFNSKVVQDFFEFQWNSYAKSLHYFGAFIHLMYLIFFSVYSNLIFIHRNFESRPILCWAMLITLIYPMTYDMLQLKKQGPTEYFKDKWNYLDQGHIWFGVTNIIIQRTIPDIMHPVS